MVERYIVIVDAESSILSNRPIKKIETFASAAPGIYGVKLTK